MAAATTACDALVVGGGFYGSVIAAALARQRPDWHVALLEQGPALMRRASYTNQARVHNGYHYPRSFTTAFRSRVNLPRFLADYGDAIRRDVHKLYAIARRHSKVTARQFERACAAVGAKLAPAPASLCRLFNPHLIDQVYEVEEYVFDATALARAAASALRDSGVRVELRSRAQQIQRSPRGGLCLDVQRGDDPPARWSAPLVLNCTYSRIHQLCAASPQGATGLRHEIAEMALVQVPAPLEQLGVTVMDGPFFSLMPFPARQLHTLSHVRYTPHTQWEDRPGLDPYARLAAYPRQSRFERMQRDACRYMPCLAEARQQDSLYEVKTVLQRNDVDDGRPILLESHAELPGLHAVLGGKIDNIYDILALLQERLASALRAPKRPPTRPHPAGGDLYA